MFQKLLSVVISKIMRRKLHVLGCKWLIKISQERYSVYILLKFKTNLEHSYNTWSIYINKNKRRNPKHPVVSLITNVQAWQRKQSLPHALLEMQMWGRSFSSENRWFWGLILAFSVNINSFFHSRIFDFVTIFSTISHIIYSFKFWIQQFQPKIYEDFGWYLDVNLFLYPICLYPTFFFNKYTI